MRGYIQEGELFVGESVGEVGAVVPTCAVTAEHAGHQRSLVVAITAQVFGVSSGGEPRPAVMTDGRVVGTQLADELHLPLAPQTS
jgi:hypothetical protein